MLNHKKEKICVLRQMFNVKMNTEYSTLALRDMSSIQTLEYRRMLQLMVTKFRFFFYYIKDYFNYTCKRD